MDRRAAIRKRPLLADLKSKIQNPKSKIEMMSTAVATKSITRQVPPEEKASAPPASGIAFALFLAVNATLFVRPAEVFPDLAQVNVFLFLILANLALAFPTVLVQLSPAVLDKRPTTTCVLGLFLAVILSLLGHVTLEVGSERTFLFFKTVVYYLLLISLVDTPSRLRIFVLSLLFCASITVLLAILDFHKVIELPRLLRSVDHPEYGWEQNEDRLGGSGLFQDPNDLCALIAMTVPLCLYGLADVTGGPLRLLWVGSMGMFAYGFAKTQSRGGMIALMAGLGAFMRARYGWGRTLLLGAAGLPILAVMVGGRQSEISTSAVTAQQRILLWSDALENVRGAPLFGIGMEEFRLRSGYVAHNSYLHALAELGLVGGLLFLGVVYLPISGLYRLCKHPAAIEDPDMRRLHPYLFGALVGYAAAMLSLTLCFNMPTFAVIGMGVAFLGVAVRRSAAPGLVDDKFDGRLLLRLIGAGFCFLGGAYLFVRLFRG
jgi:O-antigen ligase